MASERDQRLRLLQAELEYVRDLEQLAEERRQQLRDAIQRLAQNVAKNRRLQAWGGRQ